MIMISDRSIVPLFQLWYIVYLARGDFRERLRLWLSAEASEGLSLNGNTTKQPWLRWTTEPLTLTSLNFPLYAKTAYIKYWVFAIGSTSVAQPWTRLASSILFSHPASPGLQVLISTYKGVNQLQAANRKWYLHFLNHSSTETWRLVHVWYSLLQTFTLIRPATWNTKWNITEEIIKTTKK